MPEPEEKPQEPKLLQDPVSGIAIAASEPEILEPGATGYPSASGRGRQPRRAVFGALVVLLGIALAIVAVVAPLVMVVQAVLVVVGLVVVVNGLGLFFSAALGRQVDVVFWLGCVWLVVLITLAMLSPVLPLGNSSDSIAALTNPTFEPPQGIGGEFVLGTNSVGLDVLARTIAGARTSLIVALVAVLIGVTIGGTIGMVAGFLRGKTDRVIGVFANALLAVPPLILLIALSTALTPSTRNIAIALSLLTIPSMVRLSRASTIAFAEREFVLAARAIGANDIRLLTRELLPNVVLPLMSLAVVMISMLIVAEASLSFLGLGIQPPNPTWGNMIAEGQLGVMEKHPYIVIVPGVCLFLTVFAFNLLGEKAQRRWDPRSAKL